MKLLILIHIVWTLNNTTSLSPSPSQPFVKNVQRVFPHNTFFWPRSKLTNLSLNRVPHHIITVTSPRLRSKMAKVRSNGRVVNFTARREYEVRKRARRLKRRNENGPLASSLSLTTPTATRCSASCSAKSHRLTKLLGQLLKTVMQQLWNRQRKQDNRWLQATVVKTGRSVIPYPVEQELVQWFRAKSKREQEKPKLRPDLQLSTEAMQLWQLLKAERKAAMVAQGQKFEAEDWWLDGKDGKYSKKSKAKAPVEELDATMEMLGVKGEEYVEEDEEGNFVFLSPEGSVVGEEAEDEAEAVVSNGGAGDSLVLPFRGTK